MIVLVTGGRGFPEDDFGREFVAKVLSRTCKIELLIHGCCRGSDILCDGWARLHKIPRLICPAHWDRGPSAGPDRNQRMVNLKPDLVIAFPGGAGTADCVRRAKSAGLTVIEARPGDAFYV